MRVSIPSKRLAIYTRKHSLPIAMVPPLPLALALYQPDIANNTGTLLRLGACMGVPVHVIHPTGFAFSRPALRRAGLDYLDRADMVEHASYAAFDAWRMENGRRLVLLTTKAPLRAHEANYGETDILMVGRESAGVPDSVAEDAQLRVRIPMRQEARSLNVAISAAIVLGEAMRQTDQFRKLA